MARDQAEAIERDIEMRRDELARTVRSLQDRAAPEQVARRVIERGGEDAAEIAEEAFRRARANPVAVGLIAVGVAWLAFGPSPAKRADGPAHTTVRYRE